MNATQQLHGLGQSLWLDNITHGLLTSGTLARYFRELAVTALVLSDLFMREMDGQELLTRSRQLLGASMPPFVFVTGSPSKLAPGEPVLGKPFDFEQLLDVVRHHC